MTSDRPRILAAMSGGVDSSVAALLLVEAGFDVVGVFMRNGISGAPPNGARSCCAAGDSRDAAAVADRLGIPFYAIDFAEEFSALIDHFVAEYRAGRTPNPCVLCNQDLKFGHLFSLADALGAEAVATGHYARLEEGRLLRARDADKDQTYYLFGVAREALPRVRFPLGDLTKAEVRARARAAGLKTADKPESMEICFVRSGDYRDLMRDRGGVGRAGNFVDRSGEVLGRHDGVGGFTVGQRRGLPALGSKHYVEEIDAETGRITLSPGPGLRASKALVQGVNWLKEPAGTRLSAAVKIRARSEAAAAHLILAGSETVQVEFESPVAAISPGQAAVFYDGDLVLGGGWLAAEPKCSGLGHAPAEASAEASAEVTDRPPA